MEGGTHHTSNVLSYTTYPSQNIPTSLTIKHPSNVLSLNLLLCCDLGTYDKKFLIISILGTCVGHRGANRGGARAVNHGGKSPHHRKHRKSIYNTSNDPKEIRQANKQLLGKLYSDQLYLERLLENPVINDIRPGEEKLVVVQKRVMQNITANGRCRKPICGISTPMVQAKADDPMVHFALLEATEVACSQR